MSQEREGCMRMIESSMETSCSQGNLEIVNTVFSFSGCCVFYSLILSVHRYARQQCRLSLKIVLLRVFPSICSLAGRKSTKIPEG